LRERAVDDADGSRRLRGMGASVWAAWTATVLTGAS
jgi:hypothetical protein